MKVTELRIGNYVNSVAVGKEVEITSIYFDEEYQRYAVGCKDEFCDLVGAIHGIPLTEEWLLSFGFELKEVSMDSKKYYGWLYFSFHLDINFIDKCYFYHWMGGNIEIKHVHQLQNLYHALTGKELTIKEPNWKELENSGLDEKLTPENAPEFFKTKKGNLGPEFEGFM